MIRSYSRVPRFDDGLNSYYQPNTNTYLAGLEAAGYIPASSTPMDGEYNPYLDPANYDTYGDDYAPTPSQLEDNSPAVTSTQARANTRSASAPIRKPTTTAVLDHKAATQQYHKAVAAAKKKAALENASAKKAIANANATLKRNGLKTYSANNFNNGSNKFPEVVITGKKKTVSKPQNNKLQKSLYNTNTNIGGYAGIGGAMRASMTGSTRKSTRGLELIDDWKSALNKIALFLTRRPSGSKTAKKNTKINGQSYNRSLLR